MEISFVYFVLIVKIYSHYVKAFLPYINTLMYTRLHSTQLPLLAKFNVEIETKEIYAVCKSLETPHHMTYIISKTNELTN